MRSFGSSAVFKLVLTGSACLALLARQQPPAESGITIKVSTQLVQVNVVVHDRNGKAVADLAQNDFEVKDAGKVQAIRLFRVDQLTANKAASAPPKTLPKNFAANRPMSPSGAETSNVTVLLFDTYNTALTDQAYANRQLAKFLKQLRPEEQVAIYMLNAAGFGIVHDFTNNAAALQAAFSKTKLQFSHELDGSTFQPSNTGISQPDAEAGGPSLDDALDAQNMIMANFFTRDRMINTCASLKALADHLHGIPGRKNLVWVTGGVPIDIGFGDPDDVMKTKQAVGGEAADQELLGRYIEEASRALNTANVAVYPVDARGLLGLPFVDASQNIKLDPRTHRVPDSLNHVDTRNVQTMEYVANLTGGRAFHDTNDLAGAVRTAIDDSTVTYTLGYYISPEEWDNKYHQIKVTVKRPGAKVRTKKGYLAREQSAPSPAILDSELRKAVWSPLDTTQLAVTARVDPSPALPNASRFAFVLIPAEMQFKLDGGKVRADFDVAFVQERKGGERVTDMRRNLKIGLTPEQYQEMVKRGMVLNEDLPIQPDTVAVRIIVLDRFSGAMGSVTMTVDAADKSKADVVPLKKPEPPAAPQHP